MIFDNISLTINISFFIFFILSVSVIGYTYYTYRHTVPIITNFSRIVLILFRSSALILVLLLLFEPILNMSYFKTNAPINLLFVDNSSSIVHQDSTLRSNQIKSFISEYQSKISDAAKVITFGNELNLVNTENELDINYNQTTTNFEKLIPFIKNQKESIASITIISDGIITEGSNSTEQFEKLNIPIFTVAIGDTTIPNDVGINTVKFNKVIYLDDKTEINCVISNTNLANKNVSVSLYDKSGLVEEQRMLLNESGINNTTFNYLAKEVGKQYLTVLVSELESEESFSNNTYHFTINVLNNKTKVLVIAGAPSNDLSSLLKSISSDTNIELNKIIQIGKNRLNEESKNQDLLKQADVIFMIDFPTSNTSQKFRQLVCENISSKNIPYFLVASEQTDLKYLDSKLKTQPFNLVNTDLKFTTATANILLNGSGIIKDFSGSEYLPPIKVNETIKAVRSGSTILVNTKIKSHPSEIPIIVSSKVGSLKSIAFNGAGFWRWRLQSSSELEYFFDTFIKNSIKWLVSKTDENIFIRTQKDIFTINEDIEFLGNVYDETNTPINNASVSIEISSNDFSKSLILDPSNNGIYTGKTRISKAGEFNYTAKIILPNNKTDILNGSFLISDIAVENYSFVLNSNYLKFISNITSGESFNIDNHSDLFTKIEQLSIIQIKEDHLVTKYDIWNNKWILFLIILLFSVEWIIRKQKGMI